TRASIRPRAYVQRSKCKVSPPPPRRNGNRYAVRGPSRRTRARRPESRSERVLATGRTDPWVRTGRIVAAEPSRRSGLGAWVPSKTGRCTGTRSWCRPPSAVRLSQTRPHGAAGFSEGRQDLVAQVEAVRNAPAPRRSGDSFAVPEAAPPVGRFIAPVNEARVEL